MVKLSLKSRALKSSLMRPEEGRSHLPPPFSLFFNAACHAHYHRAAAAKQRHSVVWLHRKRSQSFHVDKNETIKSINILQKASVTLCFISRQVLHRTIPICLPSSHLYDSRFESLVIWPKALSQCRNLGQSNKSLLNGVMKWLLA